jgi:predicted phage terminase large subunit-like protein
MAVSTIKKKSKSEVRKSRKKASKSRWGDYERTTPKPGTKKPAEEQYVGQNRKYKHIDVKRRNNKNKTNEHINISPQPGPQEQFLSTPADIAIYGGAAGSGKTYALLLEAGVRHSDNSGFGAVIFRRQMTQITNEGGLWDTSMTLYPYLGARPKMSPKLQWVFPSGAKVTFSHLQYENDMLGWQGSQIPLVCWDELTHFTRSQFFYLFSRGRTDCGVDPYIRATCNPDPDSWVAEFIEWWIDQKTGFPIPERSGVLRYMIRLNDVIYWGDSRQELYERFRKDKVRKSDIKSVTFIAADIYDNKILLRDNPGYLASLKAMSYVEMMRLLKGNWKVRPAAGLMFKRSQVEIVQAIPTDVIRWTRGWDLAATPKKDTPKKKYSEDPDYTAGVLIGKRACGKFIVANVLNFREKASVVRTTIKNTGCIDRGKYRIVKIKIPQDPGQAGKEQAESYVTFLAGHHVDIERFTGDKITRAEPFAAQWQVGNVQVLEGDWNEMYFAQLESFPDPTVHDDMVDASSTSFNDLADDTFDLRTLTR